MKNIILTLTLLLGHNTYANTINVDSITYNELHKQIVEENKQSTNKQIQDIENKIVIDNTKHKFFTYKDKQIVPISTDYYKEIMTYKNEDIDKASFIINSRLIVKELQKQGYVYHYFLKHCDEGEKDYVFPVFLMTGQGMITVFKNTMLQTFIKSGNYDYLWNPNINWHLWGTNNKTIIGRDSHLAVCISTYIHEHGSGSTIGYIASNQYTDFIPHSINVRNLLFNKNIKAYSELFYNIQDVLDKYSK